VELRELEVGERGAGVAGEQQAGAERAGRVGRARPQRGRAAGGEDVARASDAPVVAATPRRAVLRRERGARGLSRTSIAACSATSAESSRRIRRPVALPPAWTIRGAVAALQPEREVAVAVGVEAARRAPRGRARGRRPRR
jgi:hypothetical protein